MRTEHDIYENTSAPSFVLCKANGDRIGSLKCTNKKAVWKFNDLDEISFTVYLYHDNEKNRLYDKVSELQYIELPGIGRFLIGSVQTYSEGTRLEYKECTALSAEVVLGQKYLEDFSVNLGTVESIDGVQLYKLSDPQHSLLHLVLEKYPDWEIGHVDNELYSMQRCFEIDRQDVYSFLISDVSKAFQCIFTFDTLHHRIHVYSEKSAGNDTNIYVSYNNLLKSTNISSSADDIKTCLTITGADDLNVREVNMGYKELYNLDYFHDLQYMSQGLYDAYAKWKKKWNDHVSAYEKLVIQYQDYYNQIHYLESEKMPSVPESTDWTQYGLNPLKEQLAVYKKKQAVMIKAGQGVRTHKDYSTLYLPCYQAVHAINSQIQKVETQIKNLKKQQDSIGSQMKTIVSAVSMANNFTKSQLKELTRFIREDELSSSNFVVTDTMTDSERMDMLHEMLKFGQEELSRVSQPTLQFTGDLSNIFSIPEFNGISDQFQTGNYIHIALRDDYIVKARLLTIEENFHDKSDFSVTFGNIVKLKKTSIFQDVTKALNLAGQAASSVSFHASNWNKSNKDTSAINKMLADGLLSAGKALQTSQSDVVIDDRGILISNTPESKYPNDRIFIGNSQILFSDDDLKTIKTALGRVQYTKKGTTYNDFGLLAQFVIAGYIAGSVIEGDEVIGGTITGTDFNNGNGTFHVDKNGNLTAASASVKGEIKADTGYIGGSNGFTIKAGKLYSGKSSFTSKTAGVYLGTDGISLGENNPFSVNSSGYLTAKSGKIADFTISSAYLASGTTSLAGADNSVYLGTNGISLGTKFKVTKTGALTSTSGLIGGWTIGANKLSAYNSETSSGIDIHSAGYIRATNGNWRINADGTATFKNVYITGVQHNSKFGNISYTDKGTYGNFNNGFAAGTSFGLSGGALSNFDTFVCRNITAENIRATNVLADYIKASTVSANYATISSLNAATARIGTIESDYVKTGQLNAVSAKFDHLLSDTGKVFDLWCATLHAVHITGSLIKNCNIVIDDHILYCSYIADSTGALHNVVRWRE